MCKSWRREMLMKKNRKTCNREFKNSKLSIEYLTFVVMFFSLFCRQIIDRSLCIFSSTVDGIIIQVDAILPPLFDYCIVPLRVIHRTEYISLVPSCWWLQCDDELDKTERALMLNQVIYVGNLRWLGGNWRPCCLLCCRGCPVPLISIYIHTCTWFVACSSSSICILVAAVCAQMWSS